MWDALTKEYVAILLDICYAVKIWLFKQNVCLDRARALTIFVFLEDKKVIKNDVYYSNNKAINKRYSIRCTLELQT